MRRFLPLALILLLAGCNVRSNDIELPPEEYRTPAPGTNVREFASMDALRKACAAWGIAPNQPYSMLAATLGERIDSCFVPALHAMFVPAQGVVPEDFRQRLIKHESGHSYGLIHPDGRHGWAKRMFGAR